MTTVVSEYLRLLRARGGKRQGRAALEERRKKLVEQLTLLLDHDVVVTHTGVGRIPGGTSREMRELMLRTMIAQIDEQLASADVDGDYRRSELAFIGVLKRYSTQRGIPYEVWRQMGVPARVLRRGGLRPSTGRANELMSDEFGSDEFDEDDAPSTTVD